MFLNQPHQKLKNGTPPTAKCNANPTFTPVAAGGNGASVQFWYVGYDANLASVIVGFQGTDADKMYVIGNQTNS